MTTRTRTIGFDLRDELLDALGWPTGPGTVRVLEGSLGAPVDEVVVGDRGRVTLRTTAAECDATSI